MLAECEDLIQRLEKPIENVLASSGLDKKSMQTLILVGGGIRVPAVQAKLEQLIGSDKLAKHVNQDEAAVLGNSYKFPY
jgi:hypoxia up-regulated 1